jgi:membrane protease YdiL (CAAX protease family)
MPAAWTWGCVAAGAVALAWLEVRRRSPEGAAPRGTARPERWGLPLAGGAIALYVVFTGVAVLGLVLLQGIDLKRVEDIPLGTMLVGDGIGKALSLGAALGVRALLPREGTGTPAPLPRAAVAGALAGIAFLPIALGISWAQMGVYSASGLEYEPQKIVEQAIGEEESTMLLFAAFAVLAAPLFEEVLFRGLIHGGLRRWTGPAWTAAITAAAFAGFHFEVDALPPLFALGLVLSWLRERTGGLAAPIAAHACYNAVQVSGILMIRGG